MAARSTALFLIPALLLGSGACSDPRTDVPSGAALYRRHCAACHGLDGRGDGPAAPELGTPPTDLRGLARAGLFQEAELMAVIDGRRHVAVHGPRDMPVWGKVFEAAHAGEPLQIYAGIGDTRALVDYLRTLQQD